MLNTAGCFCGTPGSIFVTSTINSAMRIGDKSSPKCRCFAKVCAQETDRKFTARLRHLIKHSINSPGDMGIALARKLRSHFGRNRDRGGHSFLFSAAVQDSDRLDATDVKRNY